MEEKKEESKEEKKEEAKEEKKEELKDSRDEGKKVEKSEKKGEDKEKGKEEEKKEGDEKSDDKEEKKDDDKNKDKKEKKKKGFKLNKAEMSVITDKVEERILGSLDKEEPELVDEFLNKMKDAIATVHATEGFPHGKISKARDEEDDWLTKSVKVNSDMRRKIGPMPKDLGVRAIWDS